MPIEYWEMTTKGERLNKLVSDAIKHLETCLTTPGGSIKQRAKAQSQLEKLRTWESGDESRVEGIALNVLYR